MRQWIGMALAFGFALTAQASAAEIYVGAIGSAERVPLLAPGAAAYWD